MAAAQFHRISISRKKWPMAVASKSVQSNHSSLQIYLGWCGHSGCRYWPHFVTISALTHKEDDHQLKNISSFCMLSYSAVWEKTYRNARMFQILARCSTILQARIQTRNNKQPSPVGGETRSQQQDALHHNRNAIFVGDLFWPHILLTICC